MNFLLKSVSMDSRARPLNEFANDGKRRDSRNGSRDSKEAYIAIIAAHDNIQNKTNPPCPNLWCYLSEEKKAADNDSKDLLASEGQRKSHTQERVEKLGIRFQSGHGKCGVWSILTEMKKYMIRGDSMRSQIKDPVVSRRSRPADSRTPANMSYYRCILSIFKWQEHKELTVTKNCRLGTRF